MRPCLSCVSGGTYTRKKGTPLFENHHMTRGGMCDPYNDFLILFTTAARLTADSLPSDNNVTFICEVDGAFSFITWKINGIIVNNTIVRSDQRDGLYISNFNTSRSAVNGKNISCKVVQVGGKTCYDSIRCKSTENRY